MNRALNDQVAEIAIKEMMGMDPHVMMAIVAVVTFGVAVHCSCITDCYKRPRFVAPMV